MGSFIQEYQREIERERVRERERDVHGDTEDERGTLINIHYGPISAHCFSRWLFVLQGPLRLWRRRGVVGHCRRRRAGRALCASPRLSVTVPNPNTHLRAKTPVCMQRQALCFLVCQGSILGGHARRHSVDLRMIERSGTETEGRRVRRDHSHRNSRERGRKRARERETCTETLRMRGGP